MVAIQESGKTLQQENEGTELTKAYSTMATALLCQVVMFNRRRSGEVERMKVIFIIGNKKAEVMLLKAYLHGRQNYAQASTMW